MASIKDVAKLAGVAQSTVSNVLNKTAAVSPKKIRKVQEAINKLDFRPSITARSLKTKRSRNIGVILPNITDSHYALLFTGIERILSENGYTVSLYATSEIPAKENLIIEKIQQQTINGVIIVTCQPENIKIFKQLDNSNIKIVFIERELSNKEYNYIGFNNYKPIYDVTAEFLRNGLKNIYLITGPSEYSCEKDCIDGYKNAFSDLNLSYSESFISETNFNKESSFRAVINFFQTEDMPEVIITTSTESAKSVLKAIDILSGKLIKKPLVASLGEYSWLNGFNSKDINYPGIKMIKRRSIKLGELAAEVLIKKMSQNVFHEVERIIKDNLTIEESDRNPNFASKKNNGFIRVLMFEGGASEATQSLLPDFKKKSGIEVKIDRLDIYNLYTNLYKEATKSDYDVFQIDIPWFAELADMDYLLKLDDFIKEYPESIKGFIPGVLEAYTKYNNNYYALPYMFGTQILFYRKDLFEDFAIKSKFYELYNVELKPPKNWIEYNIIAKFFTRSLNPDSPVEYGTTLGAKFPTGAICEFLPRMWSYNNDSIDEKGNFKLDELGTIKALRNYTESFKYASPGSSDHFWDEEVEEFSQGKAAMMILFVAHTSDIIDRSKSKVVGKIGYDIIPGGKPVLGGWSLGINKKSLKREQAFGFIKWATSLEIAIPYSILGGITTRINLFKSSELLTIYPWLPKALESFVISKRRMVSKVTTKGLISERKYEEIYSNAVRKSIKGELEPEEAVNILNKKINKLLNT